MLSFSTFPQTAPLSPPARQVALHFANSAGSGGVLLRIKLLANGSRARDIRLLSAIASEDEVPRPLSTLQGVFERDRALRLYTSSRSLM